MSNCEIDELIATKVMGWCEHTPEGFDYTVWIDSKDKWHGFVTDFNPSENISDAWEVIEKIKDSKWTEVQVSKWGNPLCKVGEYEVVKSDIQIEAETVPLAICLAVLYSFGVEIGEDIDE